MFLWLLKAAKKELTLAAVAVHVEQLRAYTGYAQPEAPSPYRCVASGLRCRRSLGDEQRYRR